jgi:peptidoglycan hydrolase CwlO-like protein
MWGNKYYWIRTGDEMKFKKAGSMLLALSLVCSMTAIPVRADDDEQSLRDQKAQVESEVSDLQSQLNTLMTKMNDLETQLITTGQEIVQAEADLETAQEKEQQQYEDLKLRIKYMYEEGDGSALERVAESGSIAEVLTQAEYVQKVHSYDREQLQAYQETVQEVKDLKASLEEEQTNLQNIESEYQAQSEELQSTIDSKSAEVSNLDAMIQEAARVALEKAAAEAAAKEAAEAQAQQAASNQTTNDTTTNDTTPVQNGTTEANVTPSTPSTPTVTPETPSIPSTPTVTEPSYNASTGNAIVDRAYSWVGRAEYVWGACSPGAFDCSGFVSYCLTGAYSRLGTTYTFLTWTRVSNPQPGDVCVNANHCGIYIGNGQMIHAATEGVGVIVGSVQSGMIYVRY